MARIRKATERREVLDLGALQVPVRIITEYGRRAVRAAVNRRALYVRLPHGLSPAEERRQIEHMLDWATATARQRPETFAHFAVPPPASRYGFSLAGRDYTIHVTEHDLKSHRIAAPGEDELEIRLSSVAGPVEPARVIPKLLAKYFGRLYQPTVTRRVAELNGSHFQRPVRAVRLSDTYTRWGSCSSRGNINLATRLLLAPPAVLDAVIVHELAHLVEANHSPRFWATVARALPDYRRYDRWLKEHGSELQFTPVPLD